MGELVHYRLDGPIATIAMDDGKVNALSTTMLRALHAAFDEAERDGAIVLLHGRDGCFSAGFDRRVFADGAEPVLEMLKLGATLAERILSSRRPVVVACGGHAIAAGVFLALAADVRIGAEGPFQIGLNEVRIGLTVPAFAIELARQRLTPAHFDAAVVNATMYSPRDAVPAGFLDRVVAPGDLQQAGRDAAMDLATLDGQAHAATKLRARAESLSRLRAAIEQELAPGAMPPAPV
jgi:enoyl-CoA hydratase